MIKQIPKTDTTHHLQLTFFVTLPKKYVKTIEISLGTSVAMVLATPHKTAIKLYFLEEIFNVNKNEKTN